MYDFAIIGGGCAGLSIASRMALHHPGLRAVVIEPRDRYVDDRTWCDWDVIRHPFESCVVERFPRWRLRAAGAETIVGPASHTYRALSSGRFYARATHLIEASANVELRLGVGAHEVVEQSDGARVVTDEGSITARCVLDGRPPRMRARLLQHFAGFEVELRSPAFEPGVVTLMDFDVPQSDGIHFVYVLPWSERTALVEPTFFSPHPLPPHAYEERVRAYLRDRFDEKDAELIHRESGVIPMDTARPRLRPTPHVHRIGTAAGLVKPSTGYAFQAIQRWSDILVGRLAVDPLATVEPSRTAGARRLDAIFLSRLRRRPEHAPAMFASLFARTPPDALVRFLTDTGGVRDALRVMRALPFGPMTMEAVRSIDEWVRA